MKKLLLILALCALPFIGHAATGTISPSPFLVVLDSNGDPVSGACIWTYSAGTTTPVATYHDVTLLTANSNPIVANSSGRFTAFLTPGTSYKFVYEQACTSPAHGSAILTADNISAMPSSSANLDVLGTAGEAITAGQVVYLSDGSGSKSAGQWYQADTTNRYSSTAPPIGIAPNDITSGSSGTIRLGGQATGLTGLTTGSNYYVSTTGTVTLTAPSNPRLVGRADSTSTLVLEADMPLASTTSPGAAPALTGSAKQFLDGTGAFATATVTSYTTTLTNVLNTVAQTTTFNFSVPSMADGDVIEVTISALLKNAKGTNGTVAFDWFYGTPTVSMRSSPYTWNNDAAERSHLLRFIMQRVGTELWIYDGSVASSLPIEELFALNISTVNTVSKITGVTFTSTQTVALKLTLSAADPNFYFKPQSASVVHYKN